MAKHGEMLNERKKTRRDESKGMKKAMSKKYNSKKKK